MYRHPNFKRLNLPLFATLAFALTGWGCPPQDLPDEDDDELVDEGTYAHECDDGEDNDGDGFEDCEDNGCADSDACVRARAFLCNDLIYNDGDSLTVKITCDGKSMSASSGDCSSCEDFDEGSTDCDIYFDGENIGYFSPEFEAGEEFAFLFTVDGGEIVLALVDAECGTDSVSDLN
jgi:hypothetical protein